MLKIEPNKKKMRERERDGTQNEVGKSWAKK